MNKKNIKELSEILENLNDEELFNVLLSTFVFFVKKFDHDYKDTLKTLKKYYKKIVKMEDLD